ncbi:hypothetical protein PspLS_11018 [Pyricularia sp. CBS 133598]|nr:hypothetical protein PspLS_11018 [Pyricularia sp. CBS 133598]
MHLWNSLREMSGVSASRWLETVHGEKRKDIMATALNVAAILVLSGAKATPILMTAMLWNLLSNPRCYERLCRDIRESGMFKGPADFTAANVEKIAYMEAVVLEALRLDTPFATTIPRILLEEGAWADNYWLPGGVGMAFVALLWNFDFQLSDRAPDWKTANGAEHIRIIREKRPFWVKANPRNASSAA